MPSKFSLLAFLTACVTLSFSGCDSAGSGGGPYTGPFIGPIPEDEFRAVPPPSLNDLLVLYEQITKDDPDIVNHTEELQRAIFTTLRENVRNAEDFSPASARQGGPFGIYTDLTLDEWIIVFLNIDELFKIVESVQEALAEARERYPCDADIFFTDGKADAFRHSYWNILLASRVSLEFAEDFTTAHESETAEGLAKTMDLHNNAVGRSILTRYPGASESELEQVLFQLPYIFVDAASDIVNVGNDDPSALVYIDGRRPFDGFMSGSMTNTKSGGPWNATYYFNQCNESISGRYRIERGEAYQERRYVGTIAMGTSMTLYVDEPYAFENPDNIGVCEDIDVYLNGDENALEGSWVSSSNCPIGGEVDLSRAGSSDRLEFPLEDDNGISGYRFGELWDEPPYTCLDGTGSLLHTGTDYRAEPGDRVRAVAAGEAVYATLSPTWGGYVVIEHGSGSNAWTTTYTHVIPSVTVGADLNRGDVIGDIALGNPDYYGAHLHFAIRNAPFDLTWALRGRLPDRSCTVRSGDIVEPAFPEYFLDPEDVDWDY